METGPIWPPASIPSIMMASAPFLTSLRAVAAVGAKQTTLAPVSRTRRMTAEGGSPPARTTWLTPRSAQTPIRSSRRGCMVIRLTPKGLDVRSLVPAISASSWSGDMEPEASTPKPPPLEMAATRLRSDTQVMAPPMMANSVPRNARPLLHSRSSRTRASRVWSSAMVMAGPSLGSPSLRSLSSGEAWRCHPGVAARRRSRRQAASRP